MWEADTGKERWMRGGDGVLNAVAFSPDSRLLAAEGMDTEYKLRIWEAATGLERCQFRGVKDTPFHALTFAPDGRRVAVSAGSCVYVYQVPHAEPSTKPLDERQLGQLRDELVSTDGKVAHAAVAKLIAAADQGVALLQKELRPESAADPAKIARLIADLDSGQFVVREAAMRALEQMGEKVSPALQRSLDAKPSLEMRQRVETLLTGWAGGTWT